MGLAFSVILFLGAVLVVRSLRVRGCASFVLWMIVGMAAAWFALQFMSAGLRI